MSMTLKEQAWHSGLVLLDETAEWNYNDWPPLVGGAREYHASVVLNHSDKDDNYDRKNGQTVVVMGGRQQGQGEVNSVLVLNLAESNKQWRDGIPLNKARYAHAAVVCNGGVYVMGGNNGTDLDCIEQIDANNLLQSSPTSSSSMKFHWTTLNCRLSTGRAGCCAVAVHDRYIVVMGGLRGKILSSVDILDTSSRTISGGPSMNFPRACSASAVIGHRIFVVGGFYADSVEYLEFAKTCENEETKAETVAKVIPFSSNWMTHSDPVLSRPRACAVVAVGSCLVVAGGLPAGNSTVEVLDTHRNRVWNLPQVGDDRYGCTMVTVANQIAVISGRRNPSCATVPLMDKHTWCFRRLCEQPNEWFHQWK